jgi:hypothetical protein
MGTVKEFHSSIVSEVLALETSKNLRRRDAFLSITTSLLEDVGILEDFKICYLSKEFENYHIKLDGYSISDSEEENSKKLDLIVSSYNESGSIEKISKDLIKQEFEAVLKALPVILKTSVAAVKPSEFNELRSFLKNDKLTQIKIHFITNKIFEDPSKFQKKKDSSLKSEIYFEYWDIQKLNEIEESDNTSFGVEIDFLNEFPNYPIQCLDTSSSNEIKTYVSALPGVVLGQIFTEYGNSLLDSNIRAFLQFQGKVNKGIKSTIENEPHLFSSFNNGISITANSISFEKRNNNLFLKKIIGFQVVNGGQTSSSISYLYANGGYEKLKKVYVPTKFNVVEDKKKERDLVERVTLYSNTQNKMQDADFSSRHPFFINLESLSQTTSYSSTSYWYFERLRGSYNSTKKSFSANKNNLKRFQLKFPQTNKFTKEDLAKVYMAYKGFPNIASLGRQKCTNVFINQATMLHKEKQLNKEYYKFLISLLIIYRTTDKALKNEIKSFKANILNLTIAYLFHFTKQRVDFNFIWTNQEITDVFLSTLVRWSIRIEKELVKTSQGKMISEWSKKIDSWREIRKLSLGYPFGIPIEIKIKDNSQNYKTVGHMSQSKKLFGQIKLYSTKDFHEVLIWGKNNNKFNQEEMSALVLFINGSSLEKWNFSPSLSRIEMCLICLEKAIDENIIKPKHL